MKIKGIKFSIIALVLSTICMMCFSLFSQQVKAYALDADTVECSIMLKKEATTAGESDETYVLDGYAGSASGYGTFITGEKDAQLVANSFAGFTIKGWLISYAEQSGDNIAYISKNDLTDGKVNVTTKEGESVEIAISYQDMNTDGYDDRSVLIIDEVFEDIEIEPVFDYIYYNLDITSIVDLAKLSGFTADPNNANILYNATTKEAIVKNNSKYFYFQNFTCSTGEYYSTHEVSGQSLKIDYQRGAFKLEDEVQLNFDINIASTIEESVNIDVVGMSLQTVENVVLERTNADTLEVGKYKIAKEANLLRTTNIATKFKIGYVSNQQNVLNINYHNLYKATLNIKVDNETLPTYTVTHYQNVKDEGTGITYNNLYCRDNVYYVVEVKNSVLQKRIITIAGELSGGTSKVIVQTDETNLLSVVSVQNVYSVIDYSKDVNKEFFVKSAADNNLNSFKVSCSNYSETCNDNSYLYYEIDSIDGQRETFKQYNNPTNNFVVNINFVQTEYQVDFVTALYTEGGVLNVQKDVATLSPRTAVRGQTIALDKQNVADYVDIDGYMFVGYAWSEDGEVTNTISHKINYLNPTNKTVILCYKKIGYIIKVANVNSISIGEAKPISVLTLDYVKNGINGSDVKSNITENSVCFDTALYMDDTFKLRPSINNGFVVKGFSSVLYANDVAEDQRVYKSEYTINELISLAEIETVKEEPAYVITIYIYEDYKTFSLEYYINPIEDQQGKNTLMANLTIHQVPATAVIVKYDADGFEICEANSNTTSPVAKYEIKNLKLNDIVDLRATGVQVPGTADYYVFNYFTIDDKSPLSYSKIDELTYSHIESVINNRAIKVVYTMPSTQLNIVIKEGYSAAYDLSYSEENPTIVVTEKGIPIDRIDEVSCTYEIEYETEIVITLQERFIGFGYKRTGFTLISDDEEADGVTSDDLLTFTFTAKKGLQTLIINFERINYNFVVKQYGATFDGEEYEFATNTNYKALDVENTTLTLLKPLGYYISSVSIVLTSLDSTTDIPYVNMVELNDTKNNVDIQTYSYTFSKDEFIDIVQTYGNTVGTTKYITIKIAYSIYTYTVKINYDITNSTNKLQDIERFNFPTIDLQYDGNKYAAKSQNSDKSLNFINIPYNASVVLLVRSAAPKGLEAIGWSYTNGDSISNEEYVNNISGLMLGNIVEDKEFNYKLKYIEYIINLVADSNQGSPVSYVNNNRSSILRIYDSLDVRANASKLKGYKFKSMYYYDQPEYVEYVYNAETWGSDYLNLYTFNGSTYEANTSEEYSLSTTYYEYKSNKIEVNTSTFVIDSFTTDGISTVDNFITFYFEYDLLNISIVNNSVDYDEYVTLNNIKNPSDNLQIKQEDYAIYEVWAKDNRDNSEARKLSRWETVTIYHTVSIIIQINTSAPNSKVDAGGNLVDTNRYDLTYGLYLNSIVSIAGKDFILTNNGTSFMYYGNGKYEIVFAISDIISGIPDSGELLSIDYRYRLENKTLKVSTNINNNTFYSGIVMTINEQLYGYGYAIHDSVGGKSSVSSTLQFLGKSHISYSLGSLASDFKIEAIELKTLDGEVIDKDLYSTYGIDVVTKNGGIEIVYVRYVENLQLNLIVQPIIYFDGVEVGSQDYTFTKTFKIDSDFNGVAQTLSVGSKMATGVTYNIGVPELLKDNVTVTFKNEDGIIVNPINCGEYTAIISFTQATGYEWVSQITLPFKVTLNIIPQDLYLTFDADIVKNRAEKVYDGNNEYQGDINNVLKYLQFTTDGVNKLYVLNNATLMNAIITLNKDLLDVAITKTVNGKEDAVKDASAFAYNIKISNILLSDTNEYNSNFTLMNNEVVLKEFIKINKRKLALSGVNVNNKVFDDTCVATLTIDSDPQLSNVVIGDPIAIDLEKLSITFANKEVGTNKQVTVDASNALYSTDVTNITVVDNYDIELVTVTNRTIFPYTISAAVEGLGVITLHNNRGLTDPTKVDLIPLNAVFEVMVVNANTGEYADIYAGIEKYLNTTNIFAIGYKLAFKVDGEYKNVSNQLHLSLPHVADLTKVVYLTGAQSGELGYSEQEGLIMVDLANIQLDVQYIVLTQRRELLKLWQIILIAVGAVVVIGGVVTTFIIIRKRKKAKYDLQDRI